MAQVPYEGVAQVAPNATPPEDYQHIQANPASFGGFAARGEQEAGAGGQQAVQFYGQVAADDQTNKFLQASNDLLYGTGKLDPTTGQYDGGVFGLRGADALQAIPEYKQKLQDLRDQFRTGLSTPASQLQFDTDTRRMQYYMEGELGRHGKQQQLAWANEVNTQGYSAALQSIALRPQDDNFAQDTIHKALEYKIQQLQVNGMAGDPSAVKNAMLDTARDVAEVRIKSLLPTDPIAAKKLLEDNRTIMQGAPNYDALSHTVKDAYTTQMAHNDVAAVKASQLNNFTGTVSGPNNTVIPNYQIDIPTFMKAAAIQESSNGATSDNIYQIQPDTFKRVMPNGNFNDPKDREQASLIYANIVAEKAGNNPERMAVGWFSGDKNIAPPGAPNPWLNDAADKSGLTTHEYVQQFMGKLGLPSSYEIRADGIGQLLEMTKNDPVRQQKALSEYERNISAANIAAMQTAAAKKAISDNATNTYMSQIISNKMSPDILNKIANDPNLEPSARSHLWEMTKSASKSVLDKDIETYGTGFNDVLKRLILPAGDNNRISSPGDLLAYYTTNPDKISLSGLKAAQAEMKDAQANPGIIQSKNSFLKAGEVAIAEPFGPASRTPESVMAFARWEAMVLPRINEGLAKGENFEDMTKKDSPLDKSIAQAKLSLNQSIPIAPIGNKPEQPLPSFNFDMNNFDPRNKEQTQSQVVKAYQSSAKTAADWDKANALLSRLNTISNSNIPGTQ